MSGLNVIEHANTGLTIRNPANTFDYTIAGGAIAAARTLNLPVTTATDTVAVLGLAQTYTAVSTYTAAAPQIILGANTTTLGSVKMFGNTSGDVTIQPTAAAGTATVQTLPATTGTLVNRVTTANGVSASNTDGALTVTLGAITPSTVNGNTITTGTGTLTLAAGKTLTASNTVTFTGTDGVSMNVSNNKIAQSFNAKRDSGWRIGENVFHQKFGEGVIVDIEGSGTQARANINFGRSGMKLLDLGIAKLEKVG